MDFIKSINSEIEDFLGSNFSLFEKSLPVTGLTSSRTETEIKQPVPPGREELINRIEAIILNLIRDLSKDLPLVLRLRTTHWNNCNYEDDIVSLKPLGDAQMSEIRLDVVRSRHKFTIILYILSKIHFMLQSGSTCTRRELYYQNVPLVRNQGAVDSAVRDICSLLDAPSWSLGVNATSKGLISGNLVITTCDDKELVCTNTGGVLLPQNVFGIRFLESSAKFVLVIEKDATFQKLLNDGAPSKLGPCILITGKGFPDVNTRLMVKRLWMDLKIPIFALVDADPHGIEIMCSYRFGSLALSHQSDYLSVPSIRWLGVHPCDIKTLSVPTLPATQDDLAKLRNLKSRIYIQENQRILNQIEILLENKYKAEIEGVDCLSNSYLTDAYLPNKILHNEVF